MTPARAQGSLCDAFGQQRDPRKARGRLYSLPALRSLATTALLCGGRRTYAMAPGAVPPTSVPLGSASGAAAGTAGASAPPARASGTRSSRPSPGAPSRRAKCFAARLK
jgi:hypothetical protein